MLAPVHVQFSVTGCKREPRRNESANISWRRGLGSDETEAAARRLLRFEIGRVITEAQSAGSIVRAGHTASQLLRSYPTAGFSLGHILDEVIAAAAAAGIPVDMSRSE